jgi:hypothetical protein
VYCNFLNTIGKNVPEQLDVLCNVRTITRPGRGSSVNSTQRLSV